MVGMTGPADEGLVELFNLIFALTRSFLTFVLTATVPPEYGAGNFF